MGVLKANMRIAHPLYEILPALYVLGAGALLYGSYRLHSGPLSLLLMLAGAFGAVAGVAIWLRRRDFRRDQLLSVRRMWFGRLWSLRRRALQRALIDVQQLVLPDSDDVAVVEIVITHALGMQEYAVGAV
jgi:hypothetical protein